MESSQSQHTPRAKVACKECHRRRVKCNASQSRPCSNCQTSNSPCTLISSRRGSLPTIFRHSKRPNAKKLSAVKSDTEHVKPLIGSSAAAPTEPKDPGPPTSSTTAVGAEMLYAEMVNADDSLSRNSFHSKGGIVFLSEPFNLRSIIQNVASSTSRPSDTTLRLHFPVPANIDAKPWNVPWPLGLGREQLLYLKSIGAVSLPTSSVCDKLLLAYFSRFHPAYPIVRKADLFQSFRDAQASMLLLQAIFFAASIHCDEAVIREAGFPSRFEACNVFYARAKALYQADCEKDKVKIVCALFLISFWWVSPTEEKDSWHWIGAAIGLAQSMGMHRSTSLSMMDPQDRSHWKRIWWSLVVRDRLAASALGRPMRIWDTECDVEPLYENDFQEEMMGSTSSVFVKIKRHQVLYFIQMTNLSSILGKIMTTCFGAGRESMSDQIPGLNDELQEWETSLPKELRYQTFDPNIDLDTTLWAHMLHMFCCNVLILLNRPKSTRTDSRATQSQWNLAVSAANRITRMIEDVLAANVIHCVPLHTIHCLSAALSMHLLVICQSGQSLVVKRITDNRYQQCMLGLSELSEFWPKSNWILQCCSKAFEKYKKTQHQSEQTVHFAQNEYFPAFLPFAGPSGEDKTQQVMELGFSNSYWPIFDSTSFEALLRDSPGNFSFF